MHDARKRTPRLLYVNLASRRRRTGRPRDDLMCVVDDERCAALRAGRCSGPTVVLCFPVCAVYAFCLRALVCSPPFHADVLEKRRYAVHNSSFMSLKWRGRSCHAGRPSVRLGAIGRDNTKEGCGCWDALEIPGTSAGAPSNESRPSLSDPCLYPRFPWLWDTVSPNNQYTLGCLPSVIYHVNQRLPIRYPEKLKVHIHITHNKTVAGTKVYIYLGRYCGIINQIPSCYRNTLKRQRLI